MSAANNNINDENKAEAVLLEQLIFGGKKRASSSPSQFRRDYFEKQVQPKPLTPDEQFLADFDPSKFNQEPKTQKVMVNSRQHISQLKKTIAHLEQLKTVFKAGSANRMVVSQTCSKLKHLLRRLEQQPTKDQAVTT